MSFTVSETKTIVKQQIFIVVWFSLKGIGQSLPLPLSSLVVNKMTVGTWEVLKRFLFIFEPNRLLVTGMESGWQFSLAVHGFFYLSSIVFLVAGCVSLLKKHKWWLGFLLILLVTATTSTIISAGFQSIFRSGLAYLLFLLIAGIGLADILDQLVKKRWGKIVTVVLVGLIGVEVIWFGYNYFGRYPLVAVENHYFSQRLLSGYLQRVNQPVAVIGGGDAFSLARSYVAYAQKMDQLSLPERQQFAHPTSDKFQQGTVRFSQNCLPFESLPTTPVIIDPAKYAECDYAALIASGAATVIKQVEDGSSRVVLHGLASPLDSGMYLYVINDPVCREKPLAQYVHPTKISQFNVEKLSDDEFCQTWMQSEERSIDPLLVPQTTGAPLTLTPDSQY